MQILIAAALMFALLMPSAAKAQTEGFSSNRHQQPVSVDDGLRLVLPQTLGTLRWSAQVTLDYEDAPLVSESSLGKASIIRDRTTLHGMFALGVHKRLDLFVGAPFVANQSSDDLTPFGLPSVKDSAMGDLLAGLRAMIVQAGSFSLGAIAHVNLPTGDPAAFTGDDGVSGTGRVAVMYGSPMLILAANVGGHYRPEADYRFLDIRSEMVFGAGMQLRFLEQRLRLLLELDGAMQPGSGVKEVSTPVEGLVGARYRFDIGAVLGAGAGVGFNEAANNPNARALITLGWASQAVPADKDSDGIAGDSDRCPTEPEDVDGHEDQDGCPDLDNDGDGVSDNDDRCPQEAEDQDGVDDSDGCPDADPPAVVEAPPAAPADSDGDGTPDDKDACKDEAETVNGFQDDDGCPDTEPAPEPAPAEVAPPTLPKVAIVFPRASGTLPPRFTSSLKGLAKDIAGRTSGTLSIVGHSSAEGSEATNQALSEQRANSVRDALIQAGAPAERLSASGRGSAEPIGGNDTEAQRQRNRRVELSWQP